jgi:hypothetical protein
MLAFHYCNKISEMKQLLKKTGLFWLTVLEILFTASEPGTRQHIKVEHVASDRGVCLPYGSWEAKREDRQRSHSPLQGHSHNDLTPASRHHLPIAPKLRTETLTHGLLETLQIQTIARAFQPVGSAIYWICWIIE